MRAYRNLRACLAAFSFLAASACGNQQIVPDDLANDQSSANEYQQEIFESLPEKEQQEVTSLQASLEEGLRGELDQAKGNANTSQAIANFADRRLSALASIDGSLSPLAEGLKKAQAEMDAQQGKGFSEFNLRNMQTKLVVALRAKETHQRYLNMVIESDPAVAEAHRRWLQDKSQHKTPLTRIVESFAYEPCAFAPPAKVGQGRFVLEGVALGMDRNSANGALCAARNKDVTLTGQSEKQSHLGEYRDFGFTENTTLSELPWTMAVPFQKMDATTVRYSLAKPYLALVQYCFDCKPERPGTRPDGYAQMRNNMALHFLPDGRVAGITQTQRFGQANKNEADSGFVQSAWEPKPQPLNSLLTPLQRRLGTPSFIWSSGERPVFAWVFPDGKTALPQEKWFVTRAVGFDMIQLNSPGLIFDGQTFSRKKLIAARPRAGYCVTRHTDAWGIARHLVRPYFTYDADWGRNEAYIAARQAGKTMPAYAPVAYNARYEAPGFVDKCGIIVTATFAKDDNLDDNRGASSVEKPLLPDQPIYRLTLNMIDTNAARASFVAEEKAVHAKIPASEAQATPVFSGTASGGASGSDTAASQQAANMKGRDYGAWKTCLYKRLGSSFGYEDEVRCQALDPQGRVPRKR